jgi:8-oxo-dGTP pyrophosphatase MutT (NUDIX family)
MCIGYKDGKWVKPGGNREPGETILAAAKRECFEESGALIDFTVEDYIFSSYHSQKPRINHLFARVTSSLEEFLGWQMSIGSELGVETLGNICVHISCKTDSTSGEARHTMGWPKYLKKCFPLAR